MLSGVSTCPRCRQYLGENHRCARWVRWRRPALRAIFALSGAVAGAAVGTAIGPPYDFILIVVGAFVGYKLAPRRRRARL